MGMLNMSEVAKTERIEGRIDQSVTKGTAIATTGPRVPVFASMAEILEFAKVMSVSGIAVRAHMRNNPGVCAAICMQAQRWEMDPFMVGNKSYAVNDQIAFESQLITAVINTRAPIVGRLKTRFIGEGAKRKCIAFGTFKGDDAPTEVESPEFAQITPKNSPLWKTDPDQQLAYYTKRLWARREAPEVLLGVYDGDELPAPGEPRDITPPRPTEAEFQSQAGAPVEGEIVEPKRQTKAVKMHTVYDDEGREEGVYRASRAVAVIAGLMRQGSKIALYEHNEETIALAHAEGVDVTDIRQMYADAMASARDAPADTATSEQGREG